METDVAVRMLLNAIKLVKPCYIKVETPIIPENHIQVERSFAYELYHQWSRLLEIYKELHPKEKKLILSSEITKGEEDKKFPDILLHGGQDDISSQILICEIKRNDDRHYPSDNEILIDIRKLNRFTTSFHINRLDADASFKHGAFILINCDKQKFQERIGRLKSNLIEIGKDGLEKLSLISVYISRGKLQVYCISGIEIYNSCNENNLLITN